MLKHKTGVLSIIIIKYSTDKKMNKFIYTSVAIIQILILFGCNQNKIDNQKYMIFDDVEYVLEFPIEFTLQNGKETGIDIVGVWDFAIQDSIMILSTRKKNGAWEFVSLPELHHLGEYLTIGEGPLEFSSTPSVSDQTKLTRENGQSQAYIYDFQHGKLLKMDIYKSIKEKKSFISVINDSLPQYLFDFIPIDSITYFCKEKGNMETQQFRYIYNNGTRTVNPSMAKLNETSVINGDNYNLLTTMTKMSDQHNAIVEMHFGLNYINLYSLDDSLRITICVEKKLDDIRFIESVNWDDRIFRFSDLRVYDDFFGVVYVNEDEKTYRKSRKNLPNIFLFDWNGKPIAKFKLQNYFSSFDIDFIHKELYTFDIKSDEFFKYDIGDILSKLKNN